jgi:hypothetical protein
MYNYLTIRHKNECQLHKFQGSISPNVLLAAFRQADPKSATRQSSQQCFFVLLGSVLTKVAHEMLVKSIPGGPRV